jgi:hypothetical protein
VWKCRKRRAAHETHLALQTSVSGETLNAVYQHLSNLDVRGQLGYRRWTAHGRFGTTQPNWFYKTYTPFQRIEHEDFQKAWAIGGVTLPTRTPCRSRSTSRSVPSHCLL